MERPSGTVTLLFTDIVGSTKLWETEPGSMAVALVRHEELLRRAIESNGGFLFKTVGDAFCAAFSTPGDGLKAALAAQRALAAEDWLEPVVVRVRMGLHTGVCDERDGDYFGPAVNRVARLEAIAHGGQIVLSRSTADLVQDSLPEGVTLRDLGEHRLKDLGRPERVFQVDADGLSTEFPPLRSLDNPEMGNNLPVQLTSLVGRARGLSEIRRLVDQSRMVTLTGPGGVGKTRLALQVAVDLLECFGQGVWFVDLAPLSDPALVAETVASALRIPDDPAHERIGTVLAFLRDRELLVVLDNCEHLIDAAAAFADALVHSCPGVRVLATAREPLGISGEVTYLLGPLEVPPPADRYPLDSLMEVGAVSLFVARAREVDPSFSVREAQAPVLAELCRQLDGIPLGLELAAARVRHLTLEEIAARLDDRLQLLTAGARTAPARQQTLEATIAWSYELLGPNERLLFDALSVFTGGFTLPAAEAVLTGAEVGGLDVLEEVGRLVDRSMLVAGHQDGTSRYRMLETLRAFGRSRLDRTGLLRRVRDAHLGWVLALAGEARFELEGSEQIPWLNRIATELGNVRAALLWSMEAGRGADGLAIAGNLYFYWYARAVGEGRQWLERLLASAEDVPPKTMAQALLSLGALLSAQGEDTVAAARLEQALDLQRQAGSRRSQAWTLWTVGRVLGDQDVASAEAALQEALVAFEEVGDKFGIAMTLLLLAVLQLRWTGEDPGLVDVTSRALTLARESGVPQMVAHASEAHGVALLWAGRPDESRVALHEALQFYRELGTQLCGAHCLESAATWAVSSGRADLAATLLGAVNATRAMIEVPVAWYDRPLYEQANSDTRATLGSTAYDRLTKEAGTLSLEEAIQLAEKATGPDDTASRTDEGEGL